jgi:ferredoxin-NADP reductase
MPSLPIRELVRATPGALILRLDVDGDRIPYAAGQAMRLFLPGRSQAYLYSIAAAPEDMALDGCLEFLIGTGENGGALEAQLRPGTLIHVEGPFGGFPFADVNHGDPLLFVAGGTGIAPLRSMLRHALWRGHRDLALLYCARTPRHVAYYDELRVLAEGGDITLQLSATRAADETWTGARGRIGSDDLQHLVRNRATQCFVCGPPAMVQHVREHLNECGLPPQCIRVEESMNRLAVQST